MNEPRDIGRMSDELISRTKEEGLMDYDEYLEILKRLDERQIKNIIFNCHTRFDKTLPPDDDWQAHLKNKANEIFEAVPVALRHLLGCPMIVFRYEKFLNFLSSHQNLETKSVNEVFWEFVETFPIKNYHRAIRVKPGVEVDLYSRMLTAPNLTRKLLDYGSSTYPPIVGDFEEGYSYHVHNRTTDGSMVSWTEDRSVALFAATDGVEEYDEGWSNNPKSTIMVVSIRGNSFFFLDETEVNRSSIAEFGRESLLIMSLPARAIEKGGISFEVLNKDKLGYLPQKAGKVSGKDVEEQQREIPASLRDLFRKIFPN